MKQADKAAVRSILVADITTIVTFRERVFNSSTTKVLLSSAAEYIERENFSRETFDGKKKKKV